MSGQKIKMDVEMRLLKASVVVQEPSEIYVKWYRGTQNVPMKKRTVDAQNPVVEFQRKEGLVKLTARFTHMGDERYQKDENKLELYCADKLIGTCHFDLASYVGKTPKPEKAVMVAADSSEGGIVLKGNVDEYPGAFIEFRATVTNPNKTA